MIAMLRDLSVLLARDALGVADVVARVGPVVDDPGIPMPLEIRPGLPDIVAARLSRYPESGEPFVLTLEFARAARPAVGELKALFGIYHRVRTGPDRPAQVIFHPPAAQTSPWSLAVIASLAPSDGAIDERKVVAVALRRDGPSSGPMSSFGAPQP